MDKVKILKFLTKGNKTIYERDIDATIAYVRSFKEPENLWQRSYFQFKCHRFDVPVWKKIAYNVGALCLLPITFLYLFFSHFKAKFIRNETCICDCFDIKSMIPDSLMKRFDVNCDLYFAGYGLSFSDFRYIFCHSVYLFKSPSFLLHIIVKLARYSNLLYKFRPSLIICHNEYSYTSSVLTDYCRRHNISHYNIMHGERLLTIRCAFFEYDKCFIWHEHYENLFSELRTGVKHSDFIVELPPALRINIDESADIEAYADYKYYLSYQSEEELKSIIDSTRCLKEMGYVIKYRPHPRYSDFSLVSRLLMQDELELPSDVDINVSVASCRFVIGVSSTVLLQAFLCGKGVLVDDVTYAQRIKILKNAKYILMSVNGPELLSNHINNLMLRQG